MKWDISRAAKWIEGAVREVVSRSEIREELRAKRSSRVSRNGRVHHKYTDRDEILEIAIRRSNRQRRSRTRAFEQSPGSSPELMPSTMFSPPTNTIANIATGRIKPAELPTPVASVAYV